MKCIADSCSLERGHAGRCSDGVLDGFVAILAPVRSVEGRIAESSPRRATWLEVFGTDRVPLLSARPVRATSPIGIREFYLVDVGELSDEARARVVLYVAKAFRRSPAEVEADLVDGEHGLPVLKEDVTIIRGGDDRASAP